MISLVPEQSPQRAGEATLWVMIYTAGSQLSGTTVEDPLYTLREGRQTIKGARLFWPHFISGTHSAITDTGCYGKHGSKQRNFAGYRGT